MVLAQICAVPLGDESPIPDAKPVLSTALLEKRLPKPTRCEWDGDPPAVQQLAASPQNLAWAKALVGKAGGTADPPGVYGDLALPCDTSERVCPCVSPGSCLQQTLMYSQVLF